MVISWPIQRSNVYILERPYEYMCCNHDELSAVGLSAVQGRLSAQQMNSKMLGLYTLTKALWSSIVAATGKGWTRKKGWELCSATLADRGCRHMSTTPVRMGRDHSLQTFAQGRGLFDSECRKPPNPYWKGVLKTTTFNIGRLSTGFIPLLSRI